LNPYQDDNGKEETFKQGIAFVRYQHCQAHSTGTTLREH